MTAFWRPARPGHVARFWARCDLCGWSGPLQRFTMWWNMRGEEGTVCDHDWCENPTVERELRALGWLTGPSGYRGGK